MYSGGVSYGVVVGGSCGGCHDGLVFMTDVTAWIQNTLFTHHFATKETKVRLSRSSISSQGGFYYNVA